MNNSNAILSLMVVLLSLTVVIAVFIRIAMKIRKGGGSLTTVMLGATDHFLTKEKSRAAEVIVNQKSEKKLVEQDDEQADNRDRRQG